ncbi:Transcription initiation factor IIF, alpha subunit (TFIIF-alpha) [Popillia japonica]|uniref:Transcription initiation factor IIF subunit alpha n=1 Tax=Popillia japonica TaxID=7064 RepID=A0AAW1JBM6_POPJA
MTTTPPNVKEYSIRVPKNIEKRYHVMRFNATLDVDFEKWTQVKMERENNMKEFKGMEEDMPKFGAGSEFGREAKEEARRKKLGIITRKYKADDQPWILKSYGSGVKKFKGIREGGVSENASYYVFTHAADGAIEAFPLHEWYKFQPIQRYKALSAEEAEQEFSKRNKHLNYFSLMLRKRLRGDEDGEQEEGETGKPKKGGKSKELKISEMDEWMDSSEDDSSEAEEKEDEEDKQEKKKKKQENETKKKKQKKRDTEAEAFEESDDGDDEGRELDYISDSSDSGPEDTKLEGVAEEKALRNLLNSDEDDSENESEKSEKEEGNEEEENKEKEGEKKEENEDKEKSKKSKKKKKDNKKDAKKEKVDKKSDDEFSSDSSTDEEVKKEKTEKKSKKSEVEKMKEKEANSSRAGTPTVDGKRKLPSDGAGPSNKKAKVEPSVSNYIPGASESGITEDAVRKYLMRKPMTTTELLQKFKSKKTGLSSDQLVNIMTQILKKINPVKQTLKGKMYLSIKS